MLTLGSVGSAPIDQPGRAHALLRRVTAHAHAPGRLLVTDVPSGKARRILDADDLGVVGLDDVLALSPDGRTLAVGAGVEVVLVDTATLEPRATCPGRA